MVIVGLNDAIVLHAIGANVCCHLRSCCSAGGLAIGVKLPLQPVARKDPALAVLVMEGPEVLPVLRERVEESRVGVVLGVVVVVVLVLVRVPWK